VPKSRPICNLRFFSVEEAVAPLSGDPTLDSISLDFSGISEKDYKKTITITKDFIFLAMKTFRC
jgi:hypothetical protein